jgi:hypothetical protein
LLLILLAAMIGLGGAWLGKATEVAADEARSGSAPV